jgi:hypothetical protein
MPIAKGKYVIVRGDRSGVFAGTLVSRKSREVELTGARRIWYWNGAASISELAQRGTSRPQDCKFPAPVTRILILDAIEVIPVLPIAKKSIESVAVWTK